MPASVTGAMRRGPRDLKLIKPKDHAELSQRATELKRLLAGLLQKLNADR
ncbi:MAG TPA: hypothetical protein VIY49_21260 [Bryobacteraceae bacterium]